MSEAIRDPIHSPIRGDVIFQPAGDGTTWVASATQAGVVMGMGGGAEELVTWEEWDALCDGARVLVYGDPVKNAIYWREQAKARAEVRILVAGLDCHDVREPEPEWERP